MAETEGLNRKRGALKAKLTAFKTFLTSLETDQDIRTTKQTELKVRLSKIEDIISEFDTIQTQIETTTDNFEAQLDERQTFETLYYQLVAKAQDLSEISPSTTSHQKKYNIKLPQIQLHSFNGAHEN